METDFHLICEDSRQFDFLLGWTLFKELSMRNACDTAPVKNTQESSELYFDRKISNESIFPWVHF